MEVARGRPTRARVRRGLEHGLAVGYGLTYEGIVLSVPAYRALMEEVVAYAGRAIEPGTDPRSVHVLDVASGIGTLAFRLAREGYTIVGVEGVEYLVEVAREKRRARGVRNVAFHHIDIGAAALPWRDTFDFGVSLHTLYWHPRPQQVLEATLGALKPGGHALFANFARPVRVIALFRAICARDGLRPALRALRWLVPTALFERLRDYEPHYTEADELRALLTTAGFEILEARPTFLADVSVLGWVRRPR